jgi:hypothetical protein
MADDLENGKPSKLWSLVDGALFGLGVGVIASIFAPEIPPTWSLTFGVIVIMVGIFRWGKLRAVSFVSSAIVAALVFGAWRLVPKHDPLATRKDVDAALEACRKSGQSVPVSQDQNAGGNDKPISKAELAKIFQQFKAARSDGRTSALSGEQLEAMAPLILAEMVQWSDDWNMADRKLDAERQELRAKRPSLTPEEDAGIIQWIGRERDALNEQYVGHVYEMMKNANSLRLHLLQSVGSPEPSQDAPIARIFIDVLSKKNIGFGQMQEATAYMGSLWNRAVKAKAKVHGH